MESCKEMIIEFPELPPTSNHSYFRSKNGRMFMSSAGHQFKEMVGWLAKKYTPFEGDVEMSVWFTFSDKRKRDAQNLVKLLADSLEGYCYLNDCQIADMHIYRIHGSSPHTKVIVRKKDGENRNRHGKI